MIVLCETLSLPYPPQRRRVDSPNFAQKKKVLLVEDNEDNRIIYSTVLRHVGYDVIEAQDGVTAIALARTDAPDLILMDISIPVMDGWEATRILKREPATRGIPIIALTAHALAGDREKAATIGFSAYLAKPVEPRVVAAEVHRWIGGGDSASSV